MRRITIIAMLFVVVLSAALGAVGMVWWNDFRGKQSPLRIEKPDTIQFLRDVLKLGVMEVRLSQIYEVTQDNLQISLITIPWTGQRSVISVRGSGLVGFDLNQVTITTQPESREVVVKLPPPTLLSVDIDFHDIHEDDTFLNRLTPADRNRIRSQVKEEAIKSLLTENVKQSLAKRTNDLLKKISALLGYRITVVTVEPPAAPL